VSTKPFIKAAIFDMDGLLIDSERMIMQACIAAAKEIGITYTQAEYVELIGRAWPDSTRIMTKQLGGEENFQHVMQCINASMDTGGHEVERGKPNPDIYLLAVERLNALTPFEAHECIAFEDSEPGARAAIAAGLDVVVVPDLKQPSDFVKQNCFKVCDSLSTYLSLHPNSPA